MLPECFFCEVLRGRTASLLGRFGDGEAAQRPRMVRFLGPRPFVRALLALAGESSALSPRLASQQANEASGQGRCAKCCGMRCHPSCEAE